MNTMDLFTEDQQVILLENGKKENSLKNHVPVAHLRIDRLGYKFLITELDPDRPELAYGLCDFNTKVIVQWINLKLLQKEAEATNDVLMPTSNFSARYNLAVYAKASHSYGTIITENMNEVVKERLARFNKGRNRDFAQDTSCMRPKMSW